MDGRTYGRVDLDGPGWEQCAQDALGPDRTGEVLGPAAHRNGHPEEPVEAPPIHPVTGLTGRVGRAGVRGERGERGAPAPINIHLSSFVGSARSGSFSISGKDSSFGPLIAFDG
jgi:hypothetical protein